MNSSLATVRRKLGLLRRRIFWIQALEGLCVSAGAILAVLVAGGFLPLLPGLAGPAVRLVLLLAAVALPLFFLVRPFLKRAGEDRLALRIEAACPELGNALINAVQLGREQEAPDPRHPFSFTLLEQHLAQAAAAAGAVRLERVAPLEGLKKRFLLLAVALLLALAVQALAPHFLARSFSALLLADFSLGPGRRLGLARTAEPLTTGEFRLRYTFPAYTGLAVRTVEHSSGEITALKGTQVEFSTEALEEVRRAEAVLEPGGKIPLQVDHGRELSGAFSIMAAGAYHLEAVDRRGKYRAEPKGHPIQVEEDLYPEVTLEMPVADLEVSAGDSVEIIYRAADDFGIGAASVVYRVGQEEKRQEIFRAEQPVKERRARFPWRLSAEEFKPGEAVAFFIEVEDTDNVSGPKTSRSRTITLDIFSPRKRHEQMLARQEALFEQMLDNLAGHLEDEIARLGSSGKYRLDQAETALLKSGRAVQVEIKKLAADLIEDELTEELVRTTLSQMAATLDKILSLREGNLAQLAAGAGMQIKLREQYLKEIENDILFFDKLIKKQKIDEVLAQGQDLFAAQAELADLLQRFQQTGDPALWGQIQKKMAEVEGAYQAMLERMAKMPKEMPEEFVNTEALDKLQGLDVAKQMQDLRQALQAGDMKSALEMANSFLSSLNQMMAAMEDSAGDYSNAISAETMRRMMAMKDELAGLERAEQKLIEQTERIESQALAKEKASVESFTERTRKKIEELERRVSGLGDGLLPLRPGAEAAPTKPVDGPMDFYSQRLALYNQLHALDFELENRRQELKAGELDKMLEGFERQEASLDQARKRLQDWRARYQPTPEPQSRSLPGQAQAAAELNREILLELKSLKQSLAKKLGPEAEKRLSALTEEQEKLKERTRQLQSDFDSLSQDLPGLPSEIGKNLDQCQAFMHDAAGELSLGDPGRALVPEREAKQRLSQARQALENLEGEMAKGMKPGGGMSIPFGASAGARSGAGGSTGFSSKDFELPAENAYQVPKAFRQDILNAMKDGSPQEYKDLIHDYYERLVR